MNNEVLTVRFINVKDCFLHLSSPSFRSLIVPSVCGLKIITSHGRELYFSAYSVPSLSLSQNSLGINQIFANAVQLEENERVIVVPLYNIGSLQSISVTPKSEDDFEILQSSALTLEISLLNQLRIVWPQQAFPVWVSANISVTLVVDSVSPSIKYGRLEEYSEVVIASVIPKNGIKKKSALQTSIPQTQILKEKIVECKKLKFRCVPLTKYTEQSFEFSLHPYVVFVPKESFPEWARDAIESNKRPAWKLIKDQDVSRIVTVAVAFSNGFLGSGKFSGLSHVFISPLLGNFLNISIGDRIFLELIEGNEIPRLTGILVSPTAFPADELVHKVRETLRNALESRSELLLNTKAPYLLRVGEAASPESEPPSADLIFTLRPLDSPWASISSLSQLASLSIDVNSYSADLPSEVSHQPKEQAVIENNVPSYASILKEGRLITECSLGLNSKLKKLKINTLFSGKNGSGKTHLVNCLQSQLRGSPYYCYTHYVSCCTIKGKRVEALGKYLTEVLVKCSAREPSVLLLDDLDLLVSSTEENTEAAAHVIRVSHKLVELLDSYQKKHDIVFIATVSSVDNINPLVLSTKGKSLFTTVLSIPNLTQDDRFSIAKCYFNSRFMAAEQDLNFIAQNSEGYTPLDLKRLCDKAVFEVLQREAQGRRDLALTRDDVEAAFKNSKPSSLHQINFYKGHKTSWEDVGGLKKVKDKLIEVVCWSTMYPEVLKQCPVKPQTGILIYGAPGTGKTLLAGALAGESKMNFISIKGPELMSKYIGESEEGIRKLFEKAEAARPCLLFFDEFDSLAPRRGQDQTGVTDRVVNQLLTALDGVSPLSGVWLVAATSRPDLIDPAVLRPGRIGISVRCSLPDEKDRLEILRSLSSKTALSPAVDLTELARRTEGCTGADLKGLFTSAQIRAIDALQDDAGIINGLADLNNASCPTLELREEDLLQALDELKPSLSESERKRYQTIYDRFESRAPADVQQQKVTMA